MTEFESELASAVKTAEFFGDDDDMLINSGLVIQCAELIEQQAAQIKILQSKLLDARLGAGRQRIEPQVEGER
jgi:hypothetical protein